MVVVVVVVRLPFLALDGFKSSSCSIPAFSVAPRPLFVGAWSVRILMVSESARPVEETLNGERLIDIRH